MKKNIILYILAVLLLVVSLVWGYTQNEFYEPITAVLGALIGLLGIYSARVNSKEKIKNQDIGFGSDNTQSMKKDGNQSIFWGKGNNQTIE
jgi:hypothetical protein